MTPLSTTDLAMLERFAEVQAQLDEIDQARAAEIAVIHARADAAAEPLRAEQIKLTGKIQAWFDKRGHLAVPVGRKSVVIGGCEIGRRAVRPSLTIAGDEAAVIEALGALRWGKPFLRTKVTIDRAVVLKALDGTRGDALAELGFAKAGGEDQFFVRRAEQEGLRK